MKDHTNKEDRSENLFYEINNSEKAEVSINKAEDHSKLNNEALSTNDEANNHPLTDWDEFDSQDPVKHDEPENGSKKKKTLSREILEYIIIFAVTILVVNFIHKNVFTPVSVEGASMEPTLYDRDYLFLWELGSVDRFDIIVFKATEDDYYVKRVIGVPGDTVRYENSQLYINGQYYEEDFLIDGKEHPTNAFDSAEVCKITSLKPNERCENGVIPNGYYLVLGDNRTNSTDSRRIGLINEDTILGKTKFVLYPFDRFGTID